MAYTKMLSAFPLVVLLLLLQWGCSNAFTPSRHSQARNALNKAAPTATALHAFSSSSPSRGRRPTQKPSIRDRTPQQAVQLLQDVIQIALQAGGPTAAPQRTFQAYMAVSSTLQEYLPQLLTQSVGFPFILRTLFERLGATYIKLGQFIASSPTLFPNEYVKEFQKCLDQTEPLPFETIKRVIEQDLCTSSGRSLTDIFSYIDPKPLASASIAQVHVARLRQNDEDVVIKVQKPGIDASLQADLGFLLIAARILEFVQPDWERTSLAAVVGDLRSSMLEELDFTLEARNTIEFRRFLQDYQLTNKAIAPRVFLDYTTKKVMVMERLDGVSLLDTSTIQRMGVEANLGVETILNALNIWSMSVTSMPFFHADVHAGNLMLLRDGRVGFIDFGIVGRISPKVFNSVNELSDALRLGDSKGMAIALCNMGAADEAVDLDAFGRDIERVMDRFNNIQPTVTAMNDMRTNAVSAQINIDDSEVTDLLLEFVDVTENNGLKLPREFGLLVKQSLYFDRYLKILAPNLDVMNDSRVMIGGKPRDDAQDVLDAASGKGVVDV